MLFVLLGHHFPRTAHSYIYFAITSPIKLPLFFAISGYLFKTDNIAWRLFVKRLIRQLIVPWLILGSIAVLLESLFSDETLLDGFFNLITGKKSWYMPCCILAEVIFFVIIKGCKKTWLMILVVVSSLAIGLLLYQYNTLSIFMVNRAFCVQVFLLIGWLYRQYENRINNTGWIYTFLCFVIYAVLSCVSIHFFPGKDLDIHMCDYYCIPLNIVMVVSGVIGLFMVAQKAKLSFSPLAFIGQNTLLIYMWNALPVSVFLKLTTAIGISTEVNLLSAIIRTAISIMCCGFISVIIGRYLPGVVGKKRG